MSIPVTSEVTREGNRREAKWWFSAIAGVIITVVVPFLLTPVSQQGSLSTPLLVFAIIVGFTPLLITAITLALRATKWSATKRERLALTGEMIPTLVVMAIFALIVIVVLLTSGTSRNPVGYQMLTSGGVITYVIFGAMPVVAYVLLLAGSFSRLRAMTLIGAAVSPLAIFLWVGYYIHLIGGALW